MKYTHDTARIRRILNSAQSMPPGQTEAVEVEIVDDVARLTLAEVQWWTLLGGPGSARVPRKWASRHLSKGRKVELGHPRFGYFPAVITDIEDHPGDQTCVHFTSPINKVT